MKHLENLTSMMKSKYHKSIIKIESNLKVDKYHKKLSSIFAAYGAPYVLLAFLIYFRKNLQREIDGFKTELEKEVRSKSDLSKEKKQVESQIVELEAELDESKVVSVLAGVFYMRENHLVFYMKYVFSFLSFAGST